MWIFLILLTLFQGLSTYLMCISIAQIKINRPILTVIQKTSPYRLIEDYTPDKAFDNIYLSILSRYLLFVTGFIGIMLCIIIHDVYFKVINSKEKINVIDKEVINCVHEEINAENIFNTKHNSNNIPELNKYESVEISNDINKKVILLIDAKIACYLNYEKLKEKLNKYNIDLYIKYRFKINDSYIDPYIHASRDITYDYYIKTNSIDNTIAEIGKEIKEIHNCNYPIICICLEDDYNKTKIFRHLCNPIKHILCINSEENLSNIVNKIRDLI